MSGAAANSPQGAVQGDGQAARPGALAPLRTLTSDAIENQLMLMWRQAASAVRESGATAVARASVMTLVAFAQNQALGTLVNEVAAGLLEHVAARAIVLVPQPPEPGSPPIEVSLSIKDRDAENNPCHGEEILIRAHDDAVWHLAGAVLPLVLSGLPAFLWWCGEPPWHSELLEALVDGCDRLIVDTSAVDHVEQSLVSLADLVSRKKTSCAVTDLNWRRQTPWHELLAQFFDPPAMRSYLYGIDHVTIEYAAGAEGAPTNLAPAYLLTGWLASRLGWAPHGSIHLHGRDPNRESTLVNQQGRTITVEMNPRYEVPLKPWIEILPGWEQRQSQAGETRAANGSHSYEHAGANGSGHPNAHLTAVGPGTLMSVHLHATVSERGKSKVGTFTVAREADLETASLLCRADCAMPSQSVHLPALGELDYLVEQLHVLDHDVIYEQALTMAMRLIKPVHSGGRRSGI
jgi:hypothetical protein